MRKNNIYYLVFILSLLLSSSVNGQIYIAPNGNDTFSGNRTNPLKTLEAAIQKASRLNTNSDSIEIIVKEGVYYINKPIIITEKDWNSSKTLIIRGETRNFPIFKGSIPMPKFEKVSNDLWKIDLSEILKEKKLTIHQIFVNDKRAVRARTPNVGELFNPISTKQTKNNSNQSLFNQTIELSSEDARSISLKAITNDYDKIIVSFNHKWLRTRGYINNISVNNRTFSITTPQIDPIIAFDTSSRFYFENSRHFLNAPNEWYLDNSGILYYVPSKGENINTSVVEIPILNELLNIKGSSTKKVKNISFRNISFQHTKYSVPRNGEIMQQAGWHVECAVNLSFAENVSFENCEIANISNSAIWFRTGCKNNKVSHSYIHNLGIGGIKIGDYQPSSNQINSTNNITIDNNIIHNGGLEIPTGVGVLIMHSGNNIVSHNDIGAFRYTGISVGWSWGYKNSQAVNNKIINNHIHHLGWAELNDFGGIYTLGLSEGTEVRNNVIHDVYSYNDFGWGIYLDEGSSYILVTNNLVYNCKAAGFHFHYGKENIIKNNIFANQYLSQLEATRVEKHNSFNFTNNIVYFTDGVLSNRPGWRNVHFQADNNLYWDARSKNIKFYNMNFDEWKNKTGKDEHSVVADPLFQDPANFNFRFKNHSNIDKIKFIPFDYTQAGVYGDNEWKKKAILDPHIIDLYNTTIEKRNKV
jgi:parallel beta-helix repeat protein